MLQESRVLLLLVISSIIIQTISAIIWEIEAKDKKAETVRENRKGRNFNRGVLFSFSTDIKNKLCRDLYHVQLYEAAAVSSSEDESKIPDAVIETSEKVDKIPAIENVYGDMSHKETKEANKIVTSYVSNTMEASREVIERTADADKQNESSTEEFEEEDSLEMEVTDDPANEGSPQHALVVTKVATYEKVLEEHDVYFKCAILNAKDAIPDENLYLVSTAFLTGWFYVSILGTEYHDQEKLSQDPAKLRLYLARSPWLQLSRKEELEDEYADIHDTLETLKAESPEYVMLIMRKNDLTALTTFKRKLLCASILSSPIYQMERLEAIKSFDEDDKEYDETQLQVAFRNLTYDRKGFTANCISCYGYKDYFKDPSDDTKLFLTPSFNDRDSLYVLREELQGGKRWLLSKYFEKVSILTHSRESVEETDLFLL